jgi:FAD/FMN-containing dehydrogenase
VKRRIFCGAALASAATLSISWQRALAAATAPAMGELAAMTGGGRRIGLPAADVEGLRASLRGSLLLPGNPGYDDARRIWNAAFDRRPAMIARCSGTADVMRAVDFARTHDLLTAVRGGGHSPSGLSACEGGLMIDLSQMNGVRVDSVAKTARAEGGALLGQLDHEAQTFGLATTAGTVSHTGVGGLTLGGGLGRVGRRFGLACDNVRAVDLVTADGKLVRASSEENPELYWGVRGGGGNFGVATSFEFRLHPVPTTVFGGAIMYPFERARELLTYFAEFSVTAPDELYLDAALTKLQSGQLAVWFEACWSDEHSAGERLLQPLRQQFGKPLLDEIAPVRYVALQASADEANAFGAYHYLKGGFIHGLSPALIDVLVEGFPDLGPDTPDVFFQHAGGAIARLPADHNAFAHRAATHDLLLLSQWTDPARAEGYTAAVRKLWAAVEPHTRGFYVNEAVPDDERKIRLNYGDHYARLLALKKRYDPGNLFRLNANVRPAA